MFVWFEFFAYVFFVDNYAGVKDACVFFADQHGVYVDFFDLWEVNE
jgi:hypothetical protein